MRIHSDTLTDRDMMDAARIARVHFDRYLNTGSRSRHHGFDITLTGESRRRPNGGNRGAGDDYAATWDQWGVFLAVLFDRDETMIATYYADAAEFHYKTDCRFEPVFNDAGTPMYWPNDAHGDHTFRFSGTPGAHQCTKCSAVQRWI